jgi:glycosyltransferase involved in cell wall biosynthesis
MRVLYCNKYNYPFSGTEAYLFELMRHMESRGNATALFSMDHGHASAFAGRSYLIPYVNFKDAEAGFLKKSRMATHALYSPSARRRMRDCIQDYRPDLAHVRGIYHHLSPSILWELKRQRVPVLYHLNDFKILCPNYNFVAHGRTCELCLGGHYFHAVTERCHAGPRSYGVVLAAEAYLHKWLRTYQSCVDLFLAPTEFVREKLIKAGFSKAQIQVLHHFQALPVPAALMPEKGYILYFGRLSAEKGIDELLHAMASLPHIPLVIAGEGPERPRLESLARQLKLDHVLFSGMVEGTQLDQLIGGCSFSVFPSRAYETLGKSILESYAWGRPVVASDLGSRREMVEQGVTGILYPPGKTEQLAEAICYLFDHSRLAAQMGVEGRQRLHSAHNPDRHLDTILKIYGQLIERRPQSGSVATSSPIPIQPRLRVAFIGGRGLVSKYSGIESYYEEVGAELARRGHEVTVYCRNYFTPAVKVHLGMKVRRLPTIRSKYLDTLVHTALSTVHAMFSKYDVVHYHCLGPALFSFFPRLTGAKTAVTVQGLDWQRRKWGWVASRVLRWGESAAVAFPGATMVVSKTLQGYYEKKYGRTTFYVPNGATVRHKRPARWISELGLTADKYILFLGRFSPEKNCDLLIEAFKNTTSDMKLVLAGGSSHSDQYVTSLRQHESAQIRFLPWVSGDDLDELLTNAAIFVLPSDLEGLSLALLDAMAAGVCVLTSDIPENNEVVAGMGFTFKRGDASDLTRVLQLLIRNPELRNQMAARGAQHMQKNYLWPDIAQTIEKTYYDIVSGKIPTDVHPIRLPDESSAA